MATSSRQSSIFGVNDWKALLDVMAYMGQALSFRSDLNTRENFIDTAERRDSVIKLANLVSYTPKRNIAGQGFAKITSISTSEQVRDINNLNLSNLTILWNDPANPNWQEQFNSIVNAALIDTQRVGKPGNTNTILDIKTDEYSIVLTSGTTPIIPFSSTVDGISMNFEGVSVTSVDSDDVYEIPPGNSTTFNIVYRNDKLGYGSPNTGFFMYFKQGTLQTYLFTVLEQISNQAIDIDILGINNSDTWLYEVNANTDEFVEWKQVESVYANATLQKLSSTKKVYSVNSRTNDQVTYVFGDGVFSAVPVGSFVAYVRAGNGLTYVIDPSEFQSITVNVPYISRNGRDETLTVTLDLQLPISTAQARETLADIKLRAPQRFYTQNRMVNGEDYNNFPYTLYSSIIKSKAINRSSIGVSRNFDLLDPSAKYSSTNDFADDGGLYEDLNDGFTILAVSTVNDITSFLTSYLPNELGGERAYQYYTQAYARYLVNSETMGSNVFWNQTSNDSGESTGYFYQNSIPISVGIYSSGNVKYITEGALLGFVAPSGYYFGPDNRLIAGLPLPSDQTSIWTSCAGVVNDGYNAGEGNLNNGVGPVTLTNSIPDGAILSVIIPSFTNVFGATLLAECTTKMRLNQNFSLVYDNSLLANQERWSTSTYGDANYFVRFQSISFGRYLVVWRNVVYYFGSVSEVRFTFDRDKVINTKNFVFFQRLIDANLLSRYEMIPSTDVVYAYGTQADIAIVKYEYPVGQIYYAVLESKFYKSVNDTTSANIVNLVLQTDFLVKTGRQGLYFQYKHISGETTRIDPATSNIIDLYVLTQSYYTQYTNWIQDTTGSIAEPARPTINELTQTYSNINEYKMLTDSVIINSARFKPLFGSKAAPQLRATIKVIKATTTTASDSEIITAVLTEINSYFNIDNWDFGDTFYFSELSAYLHSTIGDLVNSVVLVPTDPTLSFGELYEIHSAPYEIFTSAAQSSDISVISALTPSELTPTT